MTRVSYKITGKALTVRDMETVLPGSAKVVAYGLQEAKKIMRKAAKAVDDERRTR